VAAAPNFAALGANSGRSADRTRTAGQADAPASTDAPDSVAALSARYLALYAPALTDAQKAALPVVLGDLSPDERALLAQLPDSVLAQGAGGLQANTGPFHQFLAAVVVSARWAGATQGAAFPATWTPTPDEIAFLAYADDAVFAQVAQSADPQYTTDVYLIAQSVPPTTPAPAQLTKAQVADLLATPAPQRPAKLAALAAPAGAVTGADTSAPPDDSQAARDQGDVDETTLANSTKDVQPAAPAAPSAGLLARWQALNTGGKVALVLAVGSVGYLVYAAVTASKPTPKPPTAPPEARTPHPAHNPRMGLRSEYEAQREYARAQAEHAQLPEPARRGYGRLSAWDLDAIAEHSMPRRGPRRAGAHASKSRK
jgi:hypothetical protein